MNAFKKFLLREIVFTISVGILSFILFQTILKLYYLPVFWIVLCIISILTGIFHYSLLQIQDKQASLFMNRFMMFTGIKMMIYLVLITAYAFSNPSNAATFLISFFIIYLMYTIFEIYHIVKHLKSS